MLSVRGRPMLEHVLDGLATAGIAEFFVVVGYRREMVEAHFRNWRRPIQFQVQEVLTAPAAPPASPATLRAASRSC